MCFAPALLAVAACLCVAVAGALAQPLPTYRRTPPAAPPAPPASAAQPAVDLTADDVLSHIGGVAQARGHVELQRLDIDLFTDYLQYDQLSDTAHAEGGTRVNRGLDWFTADRMDLEMQKSAGTMVHATYGLGKTGAGGTASRIEIIDADRAVAYDATFTGCPRNGDEHPDEHPDWVLSGNRIDIDTATNEGKATGAVLHFLGIPILAAPSLTFPVTAERKSGWLAPTADFSNSSGLTFGVPYYWNYSPNVDATLTPTIITRRGAGLTGELRYLGPYDIGQVTAVGLPDDRLAGYGRGSFQWAHEGERAAGLFDYSVRWQQVSDDQYWKDFPHQVPALTQRLLPTDLSAVRRIPLGDSGEFETYARVQRWQTLQDFEDPSAVIQAPYQRSPQVGLRGGHTFANQLHVDLETEANRFDLEDRAPGDDRSGGERAHLVAAISREFSAPWGRFEPRLQLNGASYRTDEPMIDGRTDASRWIPTFSTDSSISLERNTSLFGHEFLQTLEPRLLYVYTPYRNQSTLPIYDTAAKDFNSLSIYSDNDFTGIDRVSDLNAVVAGASTRFNDLENGREYVRLGVAQRFLFKDEEVAPDNTPDTRRVSDLLLWGSTSAFSGWNLDGELDFNPSSNWTQRAIVSTRYSPGPYRTVGLTYRYARGSSEQYEVSGQWPIYHRDAPSTSGCCGGTLYAVGRVNYSVSDSRANYAVGGVEYDAGCWVGRLIFERQSTGRSEATTHVILQLELIGLSTLGSGTLRVLKDNIPGYQPLHDESASAQIPR